MVLANRYISLGKNRSFKFNNFLLNGESIKFYFFIPFREVAYYHITKKCQPFKTNIVKLSIQTTCNG